MNLVKLMKRLPKMVNDKTYTRLENKYGTTETVELIYEAQNKPFSKSGRVYANMMVKAFFGGR